MEGVAGGCLLIKHRLLLQIPGVHLGHRRHNVEDFDISKTHLGFEVRL